MPQDPDKHLLHSIMNPDDSYSNRLSFYNDPDDKAKIEQLKQTITPAQFINLIAGKYGHDRSSLDDIAKVFEGHPHNNPRNVDIALRKLSGKGEDEKMRSVVSNLHASPQMIDKMIEMPESYGLRYKDTKGRMHNEMAQLLSNQKSLNSDHVKKMLQHDAPFKVDKELIDNPAVTPELQKQIAQTPNAKLTDSAIAGILDRHHFNNSLGDHPDKLLEDLAMRHPRMGSSTLDQLASRMSPEAKTKFFDKIIGIEGGKPDHEDAASDPEENWENWSPGEDHAPALAEEAAKSKHLTPAQAEHIMRHGDFDSKWNLFHNEHLGNKYADQMYEKWHNDDSDHGYDKDELNDKIKEENPFEYDDWYEDATEAAQEAYPLSEHISDANYDDDVFMGKDKESWIDEHLDDKYDWNHTPAKKPGDTEEPEEEDFSGRHKDDHPEYQTRYDEAEGAWDKALEHAKSHETPEQVYNDYDEGLSDSIYEKAQEAYDDKMENAHEDPDFLPKHLTPIQEIHRKQAEAKERKAFEEAQEKDRQAKEKLDPYLPNRPTEHAYGDDQHHMEMAKQYADANGGAIDIGHLNKAHPNMVEKWKKIFGKKGKMSSDEIQQKIDATPKNKYNLTYGHWGANNMQNLNGQDEAVIRLDHSPESLAELKKDPEAFETFRKINDVSQRSGHPTNYNTIGWARVDFTNPKHPMIDELQSDFSSAARDYLAEHGESGQDKAKSLDKIMKINKNWRETLLNAVTKIAKANGAERISTHSPESKAAHTGADKVHSVYKDSYEKVPKQMGFKAVDMEALPLSEQGKKEFLTAKSGTPTENLVQQHVEGMAEHARMWNQHQGMAEDPVEDRFVDAHKRLAQHHADAYKQHQQRLTQIDPSDKNRNLKTAAKYIEVRAPDASAFDDRNRAVETVKGVLDKGHSLPIYGFDSALNEAPAVEVGHKGHSLPLTQDAFKKHMAVVDLLIKSQIKDDDKVAIAQALMNIKAQKEAIDGLKAQNPEAYQTITELTQVLVELFKELTNEPIEAVEHQVEAQSQLQPQDQGQQPAGDQSQPQFSVPPEQEKITHGSKELPVGAIREYDPSNIRQKSPEGKWIGVASGQKRSDFQ